MRSKKELPIEEIVEKWNNGRSYSKLAEEYNVNRMTIRNRINEYYKKQGEIKPDRKIENLMKQIPTEEIIEKWNNGIGTRQLAKDYKVDIATIRNRINKYYKDRGEIKPKPKRESKIGIGRKEIPIEEIIKKWNNGISTKQLAKDYDIGRRTIYERINEYYKENGKVKPDKRVEKKELPVEKIVEKWNVGILPKELAKEYGVSVTTINNRIKEYYKGKTKPTVKNKILKDSEIIAKYLQKGLSAQQIRIIAKSKKITIPDDVINKANEEVKHKKEDIER